MKQENENKFWNSYAARYDEFISKYAQKTYIRSLELMEQELTSNLRVLEIGTGTGLISLALADKVSSIKAIDFSPEMIKVANKKLEGSGINNIEFFINSATNTDFPDKSFDLIISSNVFHLLPQPEKALHEIIRLLADNGKIILPTYCHGQNFKTKILSSLMTLSGFKAANKWSVKQFRLFIENEGFKVLKEEIIKDKIPLSFIVANKK